MTCYPSVSMSSSNRTLALADAVIAYDVHEPTAASDHPALLMIGQPMTAQGFGALTAEITDRTVVTYDPRGLGRSTRSDGRSANDPKLQAEDLSALIGELGRGAVDVFASSGGAVAGLALVTANPELVRVLVAHEPPVFQVLADAEQAFNAERGVQKAYHERGFGAGMAAFIAMASWGGEFNEQFEAQPPPDPANYGMPAHDDGTRDDPLLSGLSSPVTAYQPDIAALKASATRILVAAGADSGDIVTARCAKALANQLGTELMIFRGGHGGFLEDEWGSPGDPATFAAQLRDALEA
jgi:pimeloyl-ACP methyl ester carboxylesterase